MDKKMFKILTLNNIAVEGLRHLPGVLVQALTIFLSMR